MSFPDYISQTERRIINRVLTNIERIAAEFPNLIVRVRDEEEQVYEGPFDRSNIRKEVGHTGMTILAVEIPNFKPEGLSETKPTRASAMFVHGNEEDVLSDGSWSEGSGFSSEWLYMRLEEGAVA